MSIIKSSPPSHRVIKNTLISKNTQHTCQHFFSCVDFYHLPTYVDLKFNFLMITTCQDMLAQCKHMLASDHLYANLCLIAFFLMPVLVGMHFFTYLCMLVSHLTCQHMLACIFNHMSTYGLPTTLITR